MKKYWLLWLIPFLVLNSFFVAHMNVYPELQRFENHPSIPVVSAMFVLGFAVPSFVAMLQWLGKKRGTWCLVALGLFAISIETFALITGWPYGEFDYGNKIGGCVFGYVPWTVPFAWTPIMLAAYTLSSYWTKGTARIFLAGALTVVFDLVLDPGAVAQDFWKYKNGGFFYGVPLINFFGWVLSGTIGAAILHAFVSSNEKSPAGLLSSAFLIITFWTAVCAWHSLWVPVIVGIALLILLARLIYAPTTS
jgi:putative membrane protein